MYSNTKEYPPIVVSKNYSIIDGTHRANALKFCGLKKILAFVGYDGVNESFNPEDPYNEEDWNEIEVNVKNFHDFIVDAKIFKNIKYHINEEEFNNDEVIEFKCYYPGRNMLDFVITRIDDSGDRDFNGPGVYMILNQTGDSFKLIECTLGELIDGVSNLAEKLKRQE